MSKDLINLMMSSSLKSKGKSLQYEASLYAGEGVGFGGQLLVPDFEKGGGGSENKCGLGGLKELLPLILSCGLTMFLSKKDF